MIQPQTADRKQSISTLRRASTCSLDSTDDGGYTPSLCSLGSHTTDDASNTGEGDEEKKRNDAQPGSGEVGKAIPGSYDLSWDDPPVTESLIRPGEGETSEPADSALTSEAPPHPLPSSVATGEAGEKTSSSWFPNAFQWPAWPGSQADSSTRCAKLQAKLDKVLQQNANLEAKLGDTEKTLQGLLDAEAERMKESALTTWIKDTVMATIARILGMVDRVVIKPPQALHERMSDQDWFKFTKSRVTGFSVWPLVSAVGSTAVSNLPSTIGSAAASVGTAAASAVSGVTEQATKSCNAAWNWGASYFGGGSEANDDSAKETEATGTGGLSHSAPRIVI